MTREATIEDSAAVATIHVRTWQAAYAEIIPRDYLAGLSVKRRSEFWRKEIADKRSIVMIAVEEEEVVGWASGGASRDTDANGTSEIYGIYVSPEWWQRGIGSQLIERIEESMSPCSAITLWVLAQNARATSFYRKLGYDFDGAEKTIELGGVSLSEVRLRKLTPNQAVQRTRFARR